MTAPNPPDDGLAMLVREAQSGSESAFRRLVERCYRQIHRWALVRSGDADDADDITQDVLVRLSTHLDRYDGRSHFTTWLYRVTANAAGGFFRRRRARRRADQRAQEQALEPDAPAADPLARIHGAQMAGVVKAFFHALPARQREILDLADLQGYQPSEIARLLEMNPATVRAHLFRARRTLRSRMLAEHPGLMEDLTP